MRWRRAQPPGADAAPAGTATRFHGVALDEGGLTGSGLYEVTTTDGVPVRLHDMSFLDLTYTPASPPSLVLRFGYDDPAHTPVEALRTPVAVFTFGGVLVLRHEDEPAAPDTPAGALGLVASFDHDEALGIFALSTYTTHLVFRAASVELTLRPRPPS